MSRRGQLSLVLLLLVTATAPLGACDDSSGGSSDIENDATTDDANGDTTTTDTATPVDTVATTDTVETVDTATVDTATAPSAELTATATFDGVGSDVTVGLGADVTFDVSFTVTPVNCPGCKVQVLIDHGGEPTCVYGGQPSGVTGFTGHETGSFTAGSVGVVTVIVAAVKAGDCAAARVDYAAGDALATVAVGTVTVGPVTVTPRVLDGVGDDLDGVRIAAGSYFRAFFDVSVVDDVCPTCTTRVSVGVDGVAQACLYDGVPGAAPGASLTSVGVLLRAPNTPGVHEIQWEARGDGECGTGAVTRALPATIDAVSPSGHPLRNTVTSRCLDVPASSAEDGVQLISYDCSGASNQDFTFHYVLETDDWEIHAEHSDKCLTVKDASTSSGAEIVQSACAFSSSQRYRLYTRGGALELRPRQIGGGLCLDAGTGENLAGLTQRGCYADATISLFPVPIQRFSFGP